MKFHVWKSLMPEDLSFVSLYSGCGGLDLGFAQQGFRPVWANDVDPDAVATYNSIKELRADGHRAVIGDVRAQSLPPKGAADLVIGGPPCQGFSVAGRMDPNDPRSRHVWDFLGVVRRVQPQAFVMENVKSLAVNRRWADLRDALARSASEMGYRVQLIVANASHFGAPQARERMFLVGIRDGGAFILQPTTLDNPPTVRQVLASLPPFGEQGNSTRCTAKITPAKKPVLRRSPYAGMLFNGQGRPLDLERPALTLPASMGGNRTPIVDQESFAYGTESWVVEYHRHLWDGGEPVDVIPSQLRRITLEEAAAIQTFPASVRWHGQQSSQYRQIGNAVPPSLAREAARAIRQALSGESATIAPSDHVQDLTDSLNIRGNLTAAKGTVGSMT